MANTDPSMVTALASYASALLQLSVIEEAPGQKKKHQAEAERLLREADTIVQNIRNIGILDPSG